MMRSNKVVTSLLLTLGIVLVASRTHAADPPSAVGPLLGLLQRGTLPPERLPAVAKMVCERGNEHDLAFIFEQVTGDNWPIELRADALAWLREAVATRKVQPAGDLSGLGDLIDESDSDELRFAAVRLAELLTSDAIVTALQSLTEDATASRELRNAALDALIAYGGDVAQHTIDGLLAKDQPAATRVRGVTALTRIDVSRAAGEAAGLLKQATAEDDPAPLVDAFLNVRGGADKLAAALKENPPKADVALLALRHMYAVGRSDPSLDSLLSDLAGIKGEAPQLTAEEIKAKAELAVKQGDAAKGEEVFRRADLACLRCHAVSKAGGQIGPDLSALGASSPGDYIVKSLYDPDAQKKEEYVTRILLTVEGQQLTGIVAKRTDDKVTLKTADGKLVEVPTADIDFEADGKSLMPEGLVKFMTEQEVLDLVKFLSMLGKPGTPYEVRSTQRVQRWRVLKDPPQQIVDYVPDEELVGDMVLRARTWEPAYAKVNGELPLPELTKKSGRDVVYIQGEVDVTAAGLVEVQLNSTDGLNLWLNDNAVSLDSVPTIDLPTGRHSLTLRVDAPARAVESVVLELHRVTGSKAQFTVVDGP